MANLSPIRFKDVRLEDIDERIRDIVVIMNQFPFLETTGSCQGHPFWNEQFRDGRYTVGYILGRDSFYGSRWEDKYKSPKFNDFSRSLQEFVFKHNERRTSQFRLPLNGRTVFERGLFWLELSPRRFEDLSESMLTSEQYLPVKSRKELIRIDGRMDNSWRELHRFLRNYKSPK